MDFNVAVGEPVFYNPVNGTAGSEIEEGMMATQVMPPVQPGKGLGSEEPLIGQPVYY